MSFGHEKTLQLRNYFKLIFLNNLYKSINARGLIMFDCKIISVVIPNIKM